MSGSTFKSWFRKPSNKLPPFALRCGFWLTTNPVDQTTGHPGFTLQTVTSFHRPGLHHYYGFICHLTPRRSTSGCPLCLPYPIPDHSDIETMQGFPSYLGLPVNYPILNHATGLTRYRASRYLARLPTRYAESGSLSLCAVHFLSLPSDPAVTSNALAIRIDFPLVRATSVSFNRPGLPATLGKPKNGADSIESAPLQIIFCPDTRYTSHATELRPGNESSLTCINLDPFIRLQIRGDLKPQACL